MRSGDVPFESDSHGVKTKGFAVLSRAVETDALTCWGNNFSCSHSFYQLCQRLPLCSLSGLWSVCVVLILHQDLISGREISQELQASLCNIAAALRLAASAHRQLLQGGVDVENEVRAADHSCSPSKQEISQISGMTFSGSGKHQCQYCPVSPDCLRAWAWVHWSAKLFDPGSSSLGLEACLLLRGETISGPAVRED
ncbi:hypothetical protein RRG08_041136 [Elysia crispata]|uniref:Uncharacterized protein n=1 Tax=Elysia crispata TaxID=231223 RepID=A0AAE1CNY7_9GAST|nr:hypothetical protein RRG08_041136 [Elysia crispata]